MGRNTGCLSSHPTLVCQVTCVRHAAYGAVESRHRSPNQMGHTQ
jgi:hypothetical protein